MEFRRPYLEGTDLYSTFASKVFNKPIEECGDGTKYRKLMKTGLLATIYGTQPFTLSKQLGVSIEEAADFIDTFFTSYPVIAKWVEGIHNKTDIEGYVETLFGRKRRFIGHTNIAKRYKVVCEEVKRHNKGVLPDHIWQCKSIPYKVKQQYWELSKEYGVVIRQSVNAIVQGTGAQIMKRAMINVYNFFKELGPEYKILATIHDELILEVPEDIAPEVVEEIENKMKGCVTLAVPMKVDTEVMIRWGEGVPKKAWIDAHCGRNVFK